MTVAIYAAVTLLGQVALLPGHAGQSQKYGPQIPGHALFHFSRSHFENVTRRRNFWGESCFLISDFQGGRVQRRRRGCIRGSPFRTLHGPI